MLLRAEVIKRSFNSVELFHFLMVRKVLMDRQTRKGQAFVLILLVILGIIVVFAFLSTRSARVRFTPVVQEGFWLVGDQRVTTATVGVEVEAHVVVKATEEYVGSIMVRIRKDISFWWDSDFSVKTVPVNLRGGRETELELTFVPDEASAGRLRGYFVEVDFSVTQTSWVMENTYPPRLRVTTQVPID